MIIAFKTHVRTPDHMLKSGTPAQGPTGIYVLLLLSEHVYNYTRGMICLFLFISIFLKFTLLFLLHLNAQNRINLSISIQISSLESVLKNPLFFLDMLHWKHPFILRWGNVLILGLYFHF